MPSAPFADLARLAVHTVTTRPWGIEAAVANYAAAGLGGITVWRDCPGLDALGHAATGRRYRTLPLPG